MFAKLAKEDYESQIHVMTINSGKLLYGLFRSEWFTEKQLLSCWLGASQVSHPFSSTDFLFTYQMLGNNKEAISLQFEIRMMAHVHTKELNLPNVGS